MAKGKEPVVKLVPVKPVPAKCRVSGRLSRSPGARGILDQGFWDPLPEDALGWGGGEDPLG